MKNWKLYSKDQIYKSLEGQYSDSRSKLGINFIEVDKDTWSLIITKETEIHDTFDIDSLQDLYWANNLLMERHNTTDFIMGACRYNDLPYEEYEKIRQSIIRSFI
jgi:hypothetical protein